MERKLEKITVRELLELHKAKRLNFDIEIQRKAEQWDIKRKSLFMMSIFQNYPIPDLHILKDGETYYVLDGKQRLTTLISFLEGEFKLTPKLLESEEDISVYRENGAQYPESFILNLTFEDMPDEIRERLPEYEFTANFYDREKVKNRDIEQIYRRINNGVPLGADQKLKVALGFDLLKEISRLVESDFLREIANISKGGCNLAERMRKAHASRKK